MNVKSSRSGFSLVELLTVIAIIAILASIIFPVMSKVKENARQNQCMTNLHQIGMAVQMFKQDNRRYPTVLCGPVVAGEPIESTRGKDGQLFGEYVKSGIKAFHCPSAQTEKGTDWVQYPPVPAGATPVSAYTYDSYDGYVRGTFPSYGTSELHYVPKWADGDWDAASGDPVSGTGLYAYPPIASNGNDTLAIQKEDYERQLCWRTPPGDTVITWCSYHETRETADDAKTWDGKSLILFLDGSADAMPANEVGQCKWRTRPRKS